MRAKRVRTDSAGETAVVEEGLFLRGRRAAEAGVAVREAAEAGDDVAVNNGVVEPLRVAERLEQGEGPLLIVHVLGVLEGQVEEGAQALLDLEVEARVDGATGDGKRQGIGGEGMGRAAIEIAWELVEQDEEGERASGVASQTL